MDSSFWIKCRYFVQEEVLFGDVKNWRQMRELDDVKYDKEWGGNQSKEMYGTLSVVNCSNHWIMFQQLCSLNGGKILGEISQNLTSFRVFLGDMSEWRLLIGWLGSSHDCEWDSAEREMMPWLPSWGEGQPWGNHESHGFQANFKPQSRKDTGRNDGETMKSPHGEPWSNHKGESQSPHRWKPQSHHRGTTEIHGWISTNYVLYSINKILKLETNTHSSKIPSSAWSQLASLLYFSFVLFQGEGHIFVLVTACICLNKLNYLLVNITDMSTFKYA